MVHCHYPFYILFLVLLFCTTLSVEVQANDNVESAGNILMFILPATGACLTLVQTDSQGTLELAESAALTMGVTYGLKNIINEQRPNGGTRSFPSSHASISFVSAEFVRNRYKWEYGLPMYALASFVAYSRVESKKHYIHDVAAGAAIGIGSSYLFTHPYEGWRIQGETDHKYYGISFNRTW